VVRRGLLVSAALVGLGLLQLTGGGETALPVTPEGSEPGTVSFEIPEIHPLLPQPPSWAPRSRRRTPARQHRRPLVAAHAPAPVSMPEQERVRAGFEPAPFSTAVAAPGSRVAPPPPSVFISPPVFALEIVAAPPVSRPADEPEVTVSRSAPPSSQSARNSLQSFHEHPPEAVSLHPAPPVSSVPPLERTVGEKLPAPEVGSVSPLLAPTVTGKLPNREVVSAGPSPERVVAKEPPAREFVSAEKLPVRKAVPARLSVERTVTEKRPTREVLPAPPSPERAAKQRRPAREIVSGPARVAPNVEPPAEVPADPWPVLAVGRQVDLEDLGGVAFSQSIFVQASGILGGSGMIPGRLLNRGTVSPGHSPGLLEIAGDFSQSADARLDIELAGTNPEDFDRIIVEGMATLSGVIEVLLIDGFLPEEGDSFAVLTAERIVDEGVSFVLPALGVGLVLSAGILDLGEMQVLELSTMSAPQLAAVPEASTALLLVVGLGGLAALRRLRM
jgi:hypothetical protein